MRHRGWLWLVGFLVPLAASCGGECKGALKDVGKGCPAMFDGTDAQLPPCLPDYPLPWRARQCGDLIELSVSGRYTGGICYYDAETHALVGARVYSDIQEFCGDRFAQTAGRQPASSCDAAVVAERTCP